MRQVNGDTVHLLPRHKVGAARSSADSVSACGVQECACHQLAYLFTLPSVMSQGHCGCERNTFLTALSLSVC